MLTILSYSGRGEYPKETHRSADNVCIAKIQFIVVNIILCKCIHLWRCSSVTDTARLSDLHPPSLGVQEVQQYEQEHVSVKSYAISPTYGMI